MDAPIAATELKTGDPLVCFCYRLTERKLRSAYQECGSLKVLKEMTRAGTGCKGCLSSLCAMFNEEDDWYVTESKVSSCVVSGESLMKGLLISVDGLETRALAGNSPAPQISECNMDGTVSYMIVDGAGQHVLTKTENIKTSYNFDFDTGRENLPKPFFGQIIYVLGRKNRGSGRLLTQWYSQHGIAATHENGSTGRPRVYVPFSLSSDNIRRRNKVYLAIVNPHQCNTSFELSVLTDKSNQLASGTGTMGAFNTLWVDVEDAFLKPLTSLPSNMPLYLRLQNDSFCRHTALSCYVFIQNQQTGAWSCQHL